MAGRIARNPTSFLTTQHHARICNSIVTKAIGYIMKDELVDTRLRAMADPTRRAILKRLSSAGEVSAGDMAAGFRMTRPAVSRHLRVLLDADLIVVRRQAQSRLYAANPATIGALRAWFADYWDTALPALKRAVERGRK